MNKLFIGLTYACLFNAVVLFTWAIINSDPLIFAAAAMMLCVAIFFYHHVIIDKLRQERDIYRKNYILEAQRNSLIMYNKKVQKIEGNEKYYAEEIAPIVLN
jgi:hypothetical protein